MHLFFLSPPHTASSPMTKGYLKGQRKFPLYKYMGHIIPRWFLRVMLMATERMSGALLAPG